MLTRGGFIIHKNKLDKDKTDWLRKELTVTPEQPGNSFAKLDSFPVFRESESRFRIPRHFGSDNFNLNVNKIPNGVPIDIPFVGTLKDSTNQPIAAQFAIDHIKSKGGGILSLPTGYGKTCVSLYILSQLKVKTLIIVHKEFLLNQWIERIEQFLPSATIGRIQQNKVDIQGKDIVIGMLQSIAMKSYEPNVFETFGLTIIDETHHISSKVFSKALFNVCTKYMLGLSATPIRKDGLTKVLNWFIGDIFYSVERKQQTQVDVQTLNFTCGAYNDEVPLNKLGKVSLSEIINKLVDIEPRNELIIKHLYSNLNLNRKIIVLSDRRSHCEILHKLLSERNSKYTYGLYMGGMKQDALKLSEECDVILATYSLAHEGLDIPSLDTLILSTPKTDIVQSCGRILRETTGKKNNPLIIDICDSFGSLPNQARKRRVYYKNSGFNINGKSNTIVKEKEVSGYSFVDE